MNRHGHIYSIKGELFSPEVVIYAMKKSQLLGAKYFLNSVSLKMQNFNPKLEHYEPVSSAAVSISIKRRTVNWIDIMLRSNYSISLTNPTENIHNIHSELNVIPRITDYGPALFSSADTLLMLINNTWKNQYTGLTAYFEVKITKGFSLSHKNYYIYHREYNFIFSDFLSFEALVYFYNLP